MRFKGNEWLNKYAHLTVIFLVLTSLLVLSIEATAADEAPPPAPTTTGNPEIPVKELQYLLKPLTKEDLIVEADGWQAVLKDHIAKISAKQIQAMQAEGTTKTQILEEVTKLQEQQTALIDRVDTVVDELRKKGGEIEALRKISRSGFRHQSRCDRCRQHLDGDYRLVEIQRRRFALVEKHHFVCRDDRGVYDLVCDPRQSHSGGGCENQGSLGAVERLSGECGSQGHLSGRFGGGTLHAGSQHRSLPGSHRSGWFHHRLCLARYPEQLRRRDHDFAVPALTISATSSTWPG